MSRDTYHQDFIAPTVWGLWQDEEEFIPDPALLGRPGPLISGAVGLGATNIGYRRTHRAMVIWPPIVASERLFALERRWWGVETRARNARQRVRNAWDVLMGRAEAV